MGMIIDKHRKAFSYLMLFQNLFIVAISGWLIYRYGDLRAGGVDDFIGIGDTLFGWFLCLPIVFFGVSFIEPKIKDRISRSTSNYPPDKIARDTLCFIIAEDFYLIAISIFYLLRYGSTVIYSGINGDVVTGKEHLLLFVFLPFTAVGLLSLGLCVFIRKKAS